MIKRYTNSLAERFLRGGVIVWARKSGGCPSAIDSLAHGSVVASQLGLLGSQSKPILAPWADSTGNNMVNVFFFQFHVNWGIKRGKRQENKTDVWSCHLVHFGLKEWTNFVNILNWRVNVRRLDQVVFGRITMCIWFWGWYVVLDRDR